MKTRKAVGYCRVSSDGQAERGVSLDAQAEKIRAMATVQDAELIEVIVDGGESGKSLSRPGIERLLAMVDRKEVQVVIIAKLDRLTRSVRDLGELLERFQRRGVSLVSVGESLDTGSAVRHHPHQARSAHADCREGPTPGARMSTRAVVPIARPVAARRFERLAKQVGAVRSAATVAAPGTRPCDRS